jgi:hypothetical protein
MQVDGGSLDSACLEMRGATGAVGVVTAPAGRGGYRSEVGLPPGAALDMDLSSWQGVNTANLAARLPSLGSSAR